MTFTRCRFGTTADGSTATNMLVDSDLLSVAATEGGWFGGPIVSLGQALLANVTIVLVDTIVRSVGSNDGVVLRALPVLGLRVVIQDCDVFASAGVAGTSLRFIAALIVVRPYSSAAVALWSYELHGNTQWLFIDIISSVVLVTTGNTTVLSATEAAVVGIHGDPHIPPFAVSGGITVDGCRVAMYSQFRVDTIMFYQRNVTNMNLSVRNTGHFMMRVRGTANAGLANRAARVIFLAVSNFVLSQMNVASTTMQITLRGGSENSTSNPALQLVSACAVYVEGCQYSTIRLEKVTVNVTLDGGDAAPQPSLPFVPHVMTFQISGITSTSQSVYDEWYSTTQSTLLFRHVTVSMQSVHIVATTLPNVLASAPSSHMFVETQSVVDIPLPLFDHVVIVVEDCTSHKAAPVSPPALDNAAWIASQHAHTVVNLQAPPMSGLTFSVDVVKLTSYDTVVVVQRCEVTYADPSVSFNDGAANGVSMWRRVAWIFMNGIHFNLTVRIHDQSRDTTSIPIRALAAIISYGSFQNISVNYTSVRSRQLLRPTHLMTVPQYRSNGMFAALLLNITIVPSQPSTFSVTNVAFGHSAATALAAVVQNLTSLNASRWMLRNVTLLRSYVSPFVGAAWWVDVHSHRDIGLSYCDVRGTTSPLSLNAKGEEEEEQTESTVVQNAAIRLAVDVRLPHRMFHSLCQEMTASTATKELTSQEADAPQSQGRAAVTSMAAVVALMVISDPSSVAGLQTAVLLQSSTTGCTVSPSKRHATLSSTPSSSTDDGLILRYLMTPFADFSDTIIVLASTALVAGVGLLSALAACCITSVRRKRRQSSADVTEQPSVDSVLTCWITIVRGPSTALRVALVLSVGIVRSSAKLVSSPNVSVGDVVAGAAGLVFVMLLLPRGVYAGWQYMALCGHRGVVFKRIALSHWHAILNRKASSVVNRIQQRLVLPAPNAPQRVVQWQWSALRRLLLPRGRHVPESVAGPLGLFLNGSLASPATLKTTSPWRILRLLIVPFLPKWTSMTAVLWMSLDPLKYADDVVCVSSWIGVALLYVVVAVVMVWGKEPVWNGGMRCLTNTLFATAMVGLSLMNAIAFGRYGSIFPTPDEEGDSIELQIRSVLSGCITALSVVLFIYGMWLRLIIGSLISAPIAAEAIDSSVPFDLLDSKTSAIARQRRKSQPAAVTARRHGTDATNDTTQAHWDLWCTHVGLNDDINNRSRIAGEQKHVLEWLIRTITENVNKSPHFV